MTKIQIQVILKITNNVIKTQKFLCNWHQIMGYLMLSPTNNKNNNININKMQTALSLD